MTYKRYKEALELIAGGCDDPMAIATEALRSRVVAAKPKPLRVPPPPRFTRDAVAIFGDWVRAGRPPYSHLAKRLGVSGTRANELVRKGRRMLLHPARKGHPLRDEAVKDLRPETSAPTAEG